jgi:PAS domain S-box-containing protein
VLRGRVLLPAGANAMKLFWKIYLGVLVSVVAVVYALAYLASIQQLGALEERIVQENRGVATVMAQDIEVGLLTEKWPFVSLEALTRRPDFLFWWTVSDGTIRLAHDAAFMGTAPPDALPKVDLTSLATQVVLDSGHNYGVVICPVRAPDRAMTFWLGFSLKSVHEGRQRVLRDTTAVALGALLFLGVALYLTLEHFTRPLQELKAGASVIGAGNLAHRMDVRSQDEIGELVESFNEMAGSLQQTTVSKDYVNAILNELVDALIVFDTDGKIVTTNPGALRLLGYTDDDLVGTSIGTVLPPADPVVQPANLLAKGAIRNYETEYRRHDGTSVPVLFGASVLQQPDGRRLIVSTGRDITERKQAEQVREGLISELRDSMAKIKTLRGLIPICANCKRIRDDSGFWNQIEQFVRTHSEAEFSHGICPDCMGRLYPDYVPKPKDDA